MTTTNNFTTTQPSDAQFALTVARDLAAQSGQIQADSVVENAEKFLAFLERDKA